MRLKKPKNPKDKVSIVRKDNRHYKIETEHKKMNTKKQTRDIEFTDTLMDFPTVSLPDTFLSTLLCTMYIVHNMYYTMYYTMQSFLILY